MKKYLVEVTFHATETYEIDADSADEARRWVDGMICDRDITAEDLKKQDWIVGDAKEAAHIGPTYPDGEPAGPYAEGK